MIIGGGYLASVIMRRFPDAVTLDFPTLDITSPASIEAAIEAHKPELIINTAAFTNTAQADLSEKRDAVFHLNVFGPANLALAARSHGIPWVHFSTGMFFDGDNGGAGWSETDIPNPDGYYAWTKAWADGMLLPFTTDGIYLLRIHLPISQLNQERNFINRLIRFPKLVDITSSVTVLEDMLDALDHLVMTKQPGLYNVVNNGVISSFAIAEQLHKQGLRETAPEILTLDELNSMGATQRFPMLSTDKLRQASFVMPEIQQAVERCIANFGD